jgi:hypothetical protein
MPLTTMHSMSVCTSLSCARQFLLLSLKNMYILWQGLEEESSATWRQHKYNSKTIVRACSIQKTLTELRDHCCSQLRVRGQTLQAQVIWMSMQLCKRATWRLRCAKWHMPVTNSRPSATSEPPQRPLQRSQKRRHTLRSLRKHANFSLSLHRQCIV